MQVEKRKDRSATPRKRFGVFCAVGPEISGIEMQALPAHPAIFGEIFVERSIILYFCFHFCACLQLLWGGMSRSIPASQQTAVAATSQSWLALAASVSMTEVVASRVSKGVYAQTMQIFRYILNATNGLPFRILQRP